MNPLTQKNIPHQILRRCSSFIISSYNLSIFSASNILQKNYNNTLEVRGKHSLRGIIGRLKKVKN